MRKAIALAETKQALEDLYLPFKQKRRTKGMMAREAGLEPLAVLDGVRAPHAAPAATGSAMASAFAKLQGLKK